VRLLLDTHALLWTLLERHRLSATASAAIEEKASEIYVSAVSAWEIEIKRASGKLRLPDGFEAALEMQDFTALPVTMRHAHAVELLPRHHRDPFDRMLIAQAEVEQLTLVTSDRAIRHHYPVATLPAS
jgi:PIN domain nuclease of toxin-antitoxin system